MPNPFASDSAHWDAALEHYHWDRLEEAYEVICNRGIGEAGGFLRWYRVIEAELITRRQANKVPLAPWLNFEYLPQEVPDPDGVGDRVLAACDQVAGHLGWQHVEETLISVLAEEADAPWATHPYGYCAHKEPYEKICLPGYLLDDPEEFSQAVAHEYAHVVSENLAEGNASRWLEEAISVCLEMRFDDDTRQQFCDGRAPWWSPADLEIALVGTGDEADPPDEACHPLSEPAADAVWIAYQQAGWIGRYLQTQGGGRRFACLLRKIADESPAWNLKRTLRGLTRVDGAIQEVYGILPEELFERALEFLRAQRV
jgi:hypothetical protein